METTLQNHVPQNPENLVINHIHGQSKCYDTHKLILSHNQNVMIHIS